MSERAIAVQIDCEDEMCGKCLFVDYGIIFGGYKCLFSWHRNSYRFKLRRVNKKVMRCRSCLESEVKPDKSGLNKLIEEG